MQAIDLQPAIFEYLCRYGQMGIPGIGSIRWAQRLPHRKSETVIAPPDLRYTYQQDASSIEGFERFLARKCNIGQDKASKIFHSWAKKQLHKLNEGDRVELLHVGVFTKKADLIRFEPTMQNDTAYAEEIHLDFAEQAVYTGGETVHYDDSDDDRITWLEIILPIILLALIGILAYFLWASFNEEKTASGEVVTRTEEVQPEEKTTPPVLSRDTSSKMITESNDEKVKDTPETKGQKSGSQHGMEMSREEEPAQERVVEEGHESVIAQAAKAGECIVIVGSFQKTTLADRAVEKVREKGLRPYTEAYQSYTRVGVIFDCETEDLYRKLFQLRGMFTEDAWVLKYK